MFLVHENSPNNISLMSLAISDFLFTFVFKMSYVQTYGIKHTTSLKVRKAGKSTMKKRIEINKMLLTLVLAFCSCAVHAGEYQYWDDLDEKSKSEIIKSIDVDKNIMKLYLHEMKLSDNDLSAAILDTLCSSTDSNKRMLYFYILNEIANTADGAVAEMLGGYCIKYVNKNTDYALEYFSKHQDVANNYTESIAGELYLSDTSFSQYEQILLNSAESECAKEYLPVFLKEIKRILSKYAKIPAFDCFNE